MLVTQFEYLIIFPTTGAIEAKYFWEAALEVPVHAKCIYISRPNKFMNPDKLSIFSVPKGNTYGPNYSNHSTSGTCIHVQMFLLVRYTACQWADKKIL